MTTVAKKMGPTTLDNDQKNSDAPLSRILIVDDEINIVRALTRVLRSCVDCISTALSGAEARELLERENFQVVICDYMMPDMNGTELLKWIRETHPEIVRIMLTGQADESDLQDAMENGAIYKYMTKPWADDEIRQTALTALHQYSVSQKLSLNNTTGSGKSTPAALGPTSRSTLTKLLLSRELLSLSQTMDIHRLALADETPTIKQVLSSNWVSGREICDAISAEMKIAEVALLRFQVNPAATELIARTLCEHHLILPLEIDSNNCLVIAAADPTDWQLHDYLKRLTGLEIEVLVAEARILEGKIAAVYGVKVAMDVPPFEQNSTVDHTANSENKRSAITPESCIAPQELLATMDEPLPTDLVNSILWDAVQKETSDIHIQPHANHVVMRYRIDGILHEQTFFPLHMLRGVSTRIMVMAKMDISESHRPQDGRFSVKVAERIIDVRISTIPTINGQKIVMRLLYRYSQIRNIEEIGFSANSLDKVIRLAEKPRGIVLATGPTGSGKTTTLYALLRRTVTPEKNFVTIEDPVEYYLEEATQIPVSVRRGLDFTRALRAVLRQDPDVILIGEIRDPETAEVAFNAALTGHMVYSTLHTNTAAETVTRLRDLGLKSSVIAAGLEGVISQRLLRRICSACRVQYEPNPEMTRLLDPNFQTRKIQTFRGVGCAQCGGIGYRGRIPVHEIFVPNSESRKLIASEQEIVSHYKTASNRQAGGALEDAFDKVNQGLTSLEEVFRVFGPQTID